MYVCAHACLHPYLCVSHKTSTKCSLFSLISVDIRTDAFGPGEDIVLGQPGPQWKLMRKLTHTAIRLAQLHLVGIFELVGCMGMNE